MARPAPLAARLAARVPLPGSRPPRRPRRGLRPAAAREELHAEVPDDLLELIALGERVPACAASGYWDLVEDHLAAWVHAQLPPGARDVSVVWNESLWEAVISWSRPRRAGSAGSSP
jgi:hypothetical protein